MYNPGCKMRKRIEIFPRYLVVPTRIDVQIEASEGCSVILVHIESTSLYVRYSSARGIYCMVINMERDVT